MLIRSIFFYLFLYFWTILLGIISLPYLLLPRKYTLELANIWINGILILLRIICRINYEIKGEENIPKKGVIVASKHQSAFETLLLFKFINKSIFIHKKELFFIPIFGLYLKKSNMVSINRKEGPKAMRKMIKDVKENINKGFSIIIFPEGTRTPVGERKPYKYGITALYKGLNVPCLPVAINAGYFWSRRRFLRYPGKMVIEFLKPIPPGLEQEKFSKLLYDTIEDQSDILLEEAKRDYPK